MSRPGQALGAPAQRVESLGFDSLLVPGNLAATSAVVASAVAATATRTLTAGEHTPTPRDAAPSPKRVNPSADLVTLA